MQNDWKIRTFISGLLFLSVLFFAFKTKHYASHLQALKVDRAELRHVRYGLFNVELWRIQIADAISRRVNEMAADGQSFEEFRKPIEGMLYALIDEMDANMRSKNMTSLSGLFKQIFIDIFVDLQAMKDNVPEYADVVLEQMEEPQTMQKIRKMLMTESEGLIRPSDLSDDAALLNSILAKYNFEDRTACAKYLETEISAAEAELRLWTALLAGSSLIIFLLLLIKNPRMQPEQLTVSVAAALTLLFCGISMPMIDLELVITRLDFFLMGNKVSFEDQLLFFRSKSILDLVLLMMSDLNFLLMLTGFLILLFSVLFPASKMIASVVLVFSKKPIDRNKIVDFLVYRSGKWSMADVIVVAVFMAYIGFDSIVTNQMKHLGSADPNLEILSFNGTDLQYGFYLFLMFTLAGFAISQKIKSSRTKSKNNVDKI